MIKTQLENVNQIDKVKIYGVKISRDTTGCYAISVVHSGPFRLSDYDELELKGHAVKMVRRAV